MIEEKQIETKSEKVVPEFCEFDFAKFGAVSMSVRKDMDFTLWNFARTGENVKWPIQQLTAKDLYEMRQELAKVQKYETIIAGANDAMLSKDMVKHVQSQIKAIVGDPKSVPPELSRMYVAFMRGSVAKPDRAKTIKFAKHYAIEFKRIVDGIMNLSEFGPDTKKKPKDYIIPISKSETG